MYICSCSCLCTAQHTHTYIHTYAFTCIHIYIYIYMYICIYLHAYIHIHRDSLAKMIYSNLFDWTIQQVNKSLIGATSRLLSIGILDIFGFEVFDTNSFEQLCINYSNEKLQLHFNTVWNKHIYVHIHIHIHIHTHIYIYIYKYVCMYVYTCTYTYTYTCTYTYTYTCTYTYTYICLYTCTYEYFRFSHMIIISGCFWLGDEYVCWRRCTNR